MADQYYIEQGYYTPDGYFVYVADANLTANSNGTLSATVGKSADGSASLSVTAAIAADVTRFGAPIEAEATLSAAVTASITAVKTVDVVSTQNSQFTQTATASRIIQAQAAFTDAFTPTMTVEAIRNSTAILDCAFTVTSVGVANRATSMAVDAQANLDAQAAKTVDIQSTQTSTATVSAIGTATNSASATLTSTATLSADIQNVQLAQASVASTSSIYTSRYLGTGRPRNLENPGGGFSNTIYKFGSYGWTGDASVGVTTAKGQGTIPKLSQDFVFETWFYKNSSTQRGLISWLALTPNASSWLSLIHNTNGTVTYRRHHDNSTQLNITSSGLANATWHHLLVVKNSSNVSFYVNGSRVGTSTTLPSTKWSGFDSSTKQYRLNATNHGMDETSLHIGTTLGYDPTSSTITVPTSVRTNDPDYTAFLYHFENVGDDDISVLQTGATALTSTATFTAQAQEVVNAQAALTTTSTVSAIGSLLNVGEALLTSTATLAATVGLLQSQSSTQSSAFTVSAQAVKTTDSQSNQIANASTNADAARTRQFDIALSGAFTPTLSIDVFRNSTAVLDAVATLSATVTTSVDASSNLSSTSSLTAEISLTKETGAQGNASASLAADNVRVRTTGTNWLTEAQMTAQVGQEQEGSATIFATATLSVTALRTRPFESAQTSTANLSLTAVNVFRNLGDQIFTATAAVTASVTNRIGFNIALASTSTISIVAVKTTGVVSTHTAAFAQSSTAAKTVRPALSFSSIASQLTGIGYNATGTILLQSQFTTTALVGVIKEYVPNNLLGIKADRDTNRYAVVTNQTVVVPKQKDLIMVISARRDDLNIDKASFWGTDYISGQLVRFEYINQTTARFAASGRGTATYWTWNNAVPYDNDWHQYIVRISRLAVPPFNYDEMQLWVDGNYKGATLGNFTLGEWTISNEILIGRGDLAGGESGNIEFDGDLAQLWIGVDANFSTTKYWNQGWIDLGSAGTNFGQLPTPSFYSPLDTPYTNVQFWDDNELSSTLPADQFLRLPDMLGRFSITTNFIGVFLNSADLTATSALSAQPVKSAVSSIALTATSTLTCAAVKSTGIISNQSSAFTVEADVNLAPAGGAALFDHSATLTVTIGYLRTQTVTALAETTISIEATEIPPLSGDAALTVFANQTTVAGYLISAISNQTAASTAVIEGTIIDPVRASGTLTAQTQISITATRLRPGISLVMTAGTLTADVTVIPPVRATADLSSAFTLTANVSGNFNTIALVMSTGTVSVQAVKTARPRAQLITTATLTTIPGSRIGIVAVLQANGFALTAGDVINLDPYLTLRILPESRTLEIDAETRTITVKPESRLLIIEGYA